MSGTVILMSQLKQILRLISQSHGLKTIVRQTGVSRNTIKSYLRILQGKEISIEEALKLEDPQLSHLLRSPSKYEEQRHQDFLSRLEYFNEEGKKPHVTKQLLWEEYKSENPQGYQYSRFCYYLQLYDRSQKAVLIREHHPGDKLFLDFTGDKLSYIDASGIKVDCEVFVATMGYSNFIAVDAVHSQKLSDVLHATVCVLGQIGGCPKVLVPDNLKSAVTRADRYEPVINPLFLDLANHYNMVVLPTRPRKPRDKAKVEVSVRIVYQRLFAPLRKLTFHSLQEIKKALLDLALQLNNRTMKQYGCSRNVLLERDERSLLTALPAQPYELKTHFLLTVQQNCHVYVSSQKKYYSAPYRLIGQKVQVLITASLINIYHQGNCIATHSSDQMDKYITQEQHLPSHHQIVLKGMNADHLKKRAAVFGDPVLQVIDTVLKKSKYAEQAYKTCQGILSLAGKTSAQTLIDACKIALEYNVCTYNHILRIATGKYANRTFTPDDNPLPRHNNIRGASTYK